MQCSVLAVVTGEYHTTTLKCDHLSVKTNELKLMQSGSDIKQREYSVNKFSKMNKWLSNQTI